MNVTVTQESPIMVKVEVTLPWADVSGAYDKVLKGIRKNAQVPGFRKGKTPESVLRKRFHGHIISELSQDSVPNALGTVISDHKIAAVGTPRLLDIELKEKECLKFTAQLDILPEIELQEYKGIEAERLNLQVDEAKVESALDSLIKAATKVTEISDRPAAAGETLVLALTAVNEEGESVTDEENYSFELGGEDNYAPLVESLANLKPGESTTLSLSCGDDAPFEAWRGHTIKLYLDLNKITSRVEPQLDDAFAQSQGAADLAQLKADTRERLLTSASDAENNRLDNVLIKKMMAQYDFALPRELAYDEARRLVETQMAPYVQAFQNQPKNQLRGFLESMIVHALPQAEAKIRADLVLDKIADSLNLEVSDEEINKELLEYLPYSKNTATVEELRASMESDGRLQGLIEFFKRRHALLTIRENAKLTLVDELSEAEAALSGPPPIDEEDYEDGMHEDFDDDFDEEHDHDHDHDHHHGHVHGPNCNH